MKIEDVKDRTHRCVGCSQCFGTGPYLPFADGKDTVSKWTCPTLEYYKFFANTARAKAFFAREICHGKDNMNRELAEIFFACPDCGCCEITCPPIPHTYISRAMKAEMNRADLVPQISLDINRKMKETFNIFGLKNKNRSNWAKDLDLPNKGDLLYFAGCYASFRQVKTAWAMIDILRKADINPAYLAEDEWCCGLHAGFSGDIDLERELATHNVEAIERSGAKTVLTTCANCYRTFYTDYPRLVGELPFKVVHAMEVMPELIESGKIEFKPGQKVKVTLHDPCHFGKQHLGRHRTLYNETRQIIKSLPNVDFVEMEHIKRWSTCCGGGNSVTSTVTPDFTDYHSLKRCREAKEVADILLTPCVRCVENLSAASKKHGVGIEVKALIDFVREIVA